MIMIEYCIVFRKAEYIFSNFLVPLEVIIMFHLVKNDILDSGNWNLKVPAVQIYS